MKPKSKKHNNGDPVLVEAVEVVVEDEVQVMVDRGLRDQCLQAHRKVGELSAGLEKMRAKVAEQAAQHTLALHSKDAGVAAAAAVARETTAAARKEVRAAVAAATESGKRMREFKVEAEQLRDEVLKTKKQLHETQSSLDWVRTENKRLADSLHLALTLKQCAEQCAMANGVALQMSNQYAAAHLPIGQSQIGCFPKIIPANAPKGARRRG